MRADPTAEALSHALDVAETRHLLLAQNLANVNTPNYAAADLNFEAALRDATGPVSAHIRRGGSVDMEDQLGDLTGTDAYYESCAKLLSLRYQMLRTSAAER